MLGSRWITAQAGLIEAVDRQFEQQRLLSRLWISRSVDPLKLCVDALAPLEPHVPWEEPFLTYRYQCYHAHHHPLEFSAGRDLDRFRSDAPPRLADGLGP